MKKVIFLFFICSQFFNACRSTDVELVDYKSDNLSGFFSGKKRDAKVYFFCDYISNSDRRHTYYIEKIEGMDFPSQAQRNLTTRGYYVINGERLNYDKNNSIEIMKVFSSEYVKVKFVGDTLDLPSIDEIEINPAKPFTTFKLSSSVLNKGEDLQLSWNPSGDKSTQILIKIFINDNCTKEVFESNQWNKITADDGFYTIPAKTFENLSHLGRFEIKLARASNFVSGGKKVNEVSFISTATSTFKKKY